MGIASGQPELDWVTSTLEVDDDVRMGTIGHGESRTSEIIGIDLSKLPTGRMDMKAEWLDIALRHRRTQEGMHNRTGQSGDKREVGCKDWT